MEGQSIFISSCSRRQLARRRPARGTIRLQALLLLVMIVTVLAAFAVAHGL